MRHWKRIEGFQKIYKHQTITFKPLDFKHRVVLVQGANGCGKTTLLKSLAGLIRMDSGFEHDPMWYVANGNALPETMSGRLYLQAVLKMHTPFHAQRLQRLIGQFDLEAFLDKRINGYSEGMRQRIALAAGLLQRDKPVLLDEPMRTLDKRYKKRLIEWIAQSPLPYMIATHDPQAYASIDHEACVL